VVVELEVNTFLVVLEHKQHKEQIRVLEELQVLGELKVLTVERVMVLLVVQEVVEIKDLLQEQVITITDQDVPEQVIHLLLLHHKAILVEQDIQYTILLQVIVICKLAVEVVQQQLAEMQQLVLYRLIQIQVVLVQQQILQGHQ
tara:strand:- start:220 stop:651 length:432 start_codon:yes stop_codon:yes gene_type:complete